MTAIDVLIDELVKRAGSDLHLVVEHPPRGRVRGELVTLREALLEPAEIHMMVSELLTPAQRSRLEIEQEIAIALPHRDVARFRLTAMTSMAGLAASARLIPARPPTLAELNSPDVVRRFAERRGGLVLLGGGASSGRSTTLAALVEHVTRTRGAHVVTIEDPIEFVFDGGLGHVTQREIGAHVPSLDLALEQALESVPDVVVIGDLRGPKAIRLALELAGAGATVFAVVTARQATSAIENLITGAAVDDQPRIRTMLADVLAGVAVQQLVRTVDGKARLSILETLVGSPQVTAAIREGKTRDLQAIMAGGQAQGMQTLDMGLERLLLAGRISPELALERSIDKEAFAKTLLRRPSDPAAS